MWQAFVNLISQGLILFDGVISNLGIPYSFGFAIILFTVVVKALTYPLNRQQIKSSKAQQEIQPKLKALQKKYGDDKEALAKAQMEMYKEAGINPLGGCLPILVQMPIWFGLYRALFQLAREPDTPLREGFFWIPSLSGPVPPIEEGFTGTLDWINPGTELFLGWGSVIAYLILPILLVVSQLFTQRMLMPKSDDPQQKMMGQIMTFMPLMFGYFSLVVPSALTLYWVTSNLLSMAQQYATLKERKKDEAAKATDLQQSSDQPIQLNTNAMANDQSSQNGKANTDSVTNSNGNSSSNKRAQTNAKRRSRSKRKKRKSQR